MSAAKHGCDFQIIERSPDNSTQTWRAKCSCRAQWTGSTYEAVEDEWRKHYHGIKGEAPAPMGEQVRAVDAMTTTTDRAAELRQDIEGNFALSANAYARGDYAAAANFTRQVNEAREELEGLS